MKRWLSSIIDIRKGEYLVTTLMILNIYILLVTYYLLKPARDSLFISVSGAKNLPLVFILIALVVVPVTTIYSRVSRSLKLNQLINYTSIFIIINLFIMRWLISLEGQVWVVYAFYTWVSIYGALAPAQFWLLANALYDATQAKRLFVLFGLAAIIGATTGGEITSILIKQFGFATEDLLYFCVGFMGISIFLVSWIWSASKDSVEDDSGGSSGKKVEKQPSIGEVFNDVKSSRYLMMIIGVIVMTMITATFVDYLLKAVAEEAYTLPGQSGPDKEELSAFFGKYYGRVSLLSFLVQFFLSYRLLKLFGVTGAILFLPVSQLLSAVGMALAPGLTAGVILRGSGDIFKYSIDKTGRELLFLPIPLDVKKRVKVFIDVLIDRWFRGLAGGILYIFTAIIVLTVSQISYMVIALVLLWIMLGLAIRKQYISAFRQALDKGEIDPEQLTVKINDASTVKNLVKALESDNERLISYSLGMLTEVQDDKLVDSIYPLLKHGNGEIRGKAVQVLQRQPGLEKIDNDLRAMLEDDEGDVRTEAMHYLYLNAGKNRREFLKEYLESDNFKHSTAALGCIAKYADEDEKTLITGAMINELMSKEGEDGVAGRVLLARALGRLANPLFGEYLLKLLKDDAPVVVREAIAAIGQFRDREFLPPLLNLLSDKQYRSDARMALAEYGNRILGTLSDYLVDPGLSFSIRKNVPRVLMRIPTQMSVDTLVNNLERVEPGTRHAIVRALNLLRNKGKDLTFEEKKVSAAFQKEAEAFYRTFQISQFFQTGEDSNEREALLVRALNEKLAKSKERMFRLLALIFPSKDVYNAYQGSISANKTTRASGIEFLENLLSKEYKDSLIPILDETAVDEILHRGKKHFKIDIENRNEAILQLMKSDDPWLQSCAIYCNGKSDQTEIQDLLDSATESNFPVVKETARLVLAKD